MLLQIFQGSLRALDLHHIQFGLLQKGGGKIPDVRLALDDQGDVRLKLTVVHGQPP